MTQTTTNCSKHVNAHIQWSLEAFLITSSEIPNPSYFQMDEIHADVHTDFHYIRKVTLSKIKREMLKTHRISVMLKKHHSYPFTQKRCLPSCEAVMLFQDTYTDSGGFYHGAAGNNMKSPIYLFVHIEGQILGLILSFFQVRGKKIGHSFYLYKVSLKSPSNFYTRGSHRRVILWCMQCTHKYCPFFLY